MHKFNNFVKLYIYKKRLIKYILSFNNNNIIYNLIVNFMFSNIIYKVNTI